MTGVVNNAATSRICQLSGLQGQITSQKIITLTSLIPALEISIREAEQAEKSERFWGNMLVAAKFIKATTDVMMDVLAETGAGKTPFGKVIKGVYDQAEIMGDASVGEFDKGKIGLSAAKVASNFLPEGGKVVSKEVLKRGKIVVDGLNKKLDSKKIGKYVVEQHVDVLEKSLEYLGREKSAKIVGHAKAVGKYAYELYELVEGKNEAGSGARATALNQLRKLQTRIRELQSDLDACAVHLP